MENNLNRYNKLNKNLQFKDNGPIANLPKYLMIINKKLIFKIR